MTSFCLLFRIYLLAEKSTVESTTPENLESPPQTVDADHDAAEHDGDDSNYDSGNYPLLTIDNLAYVLDNLFDGKSFKIRISQIDEEVSALKSLPFAHFTQEEYQNGLSIYKELKALYKTDEKKGSTLYGIVLGDETFLYIGSSGQGGENKRDDLVRPLKHVYFINKILQTCNLNLNTYHGDLYHKIIVKMIEHNVGIKMFAIKNLPFDPRIVEGAVYEANLLSHRTLFPELLNIKLEIEHHKSHIISIFRKQPNGIVDFAKFMVYNLVNHEHDEYDQLLKSYPQMQPSVQKHEKVNIDRPLPIATTFKTHVCNICHAIVETYSAMHQHVTQSSCPKHKKAYASLQNERRSDTGHTKFSTMFTEANDTNTITVDVQRYECNSCKHVVGALHTMKQHILKNHKEAIENGKSSRVSSKFDGCYTVVTAKSLIFKK